MLFGLLWISPAAKMECSLDSNLEIDRRLLQIRTEINTNDTLILYRHLSHKHGMVAYGKVVWKKEDGLYIKRLSQKNENEELKEFGWVKQRGPEAPLLFFNAIGHSKQESDTISWIISHDDLHTVLVYSQDSLIYCDMASEDPYFENIDFPRMQFIGSLRDRHPFIALKFNVDTAYGLGPKYFLNGKPIFDEDPVENKRLKKKYRKAMRNHKSRCEK